MERDYWVYQKRQNERAQWELYVVKDFRWGKPNETKLHVTVYSEDIDTPTNSQSKEDLHYDTVRGYVDEVISMISDFSDITNDDITQLQDSITNILID